MHILCTICSDLVNQAENIFVTKCGHIFHHHCLVQWIERSKSCPQCRNKVTEKCMFRMYPTISNENSGEDAATLQSRLDDAQLQVRQQKAQCKEKDEKFNALKIDLKRNEDLLRSYEKKLVSRDSAVSALKEQLEYVKIQNKDVNKLKDENESLKKNLQLLNGLQKVLNETSEDVENMLKGYTDIRTMSTFATALKRALCESENKKKEIRDRLHAAKQQIGVEKSKCDELQHKIVQLEDRLLNTERKYGALKKKRKASEIDQSSIDEAVYKHPRSCDVTDLNTAVLGDSNSTLNAMVNWIENTDSPYLKLKQSSLALTALQQQSFNIPAEKLKPSEYAILHAAQNTHKKPSENMSLSIFHKKQPVKQDPGEKEKPSLLDLSYDGLGGHSKLDTFPVPNNKPTFKSCVPKVTAKHKLRRPTPSGTQDIGKMFKKINDN